MHAASRGATLHGRWVQKHQTPRGCSVHGGGRDQAYFDDVTRVSTRGRQQRSPL